MSSQYDIIRDHIANFHIFLSNAPSLWFLHIPATTMATAPCQLIPFGPGKLQGCVTSHRTALSSPRRASWLSHSLLSSSHCAALRPLVNSPHQSVVTLPLLVLSLRCPLVILSCQLVVAYPIAVISLPHPLVNSLCQLVVASPLLVLLLRPTSPSHPLFVPAGCCVPS